MAITEVKRNVELNLSKVEFICPICKSKKFLDVPNSVIAEAKQLTTMSIARGIVCDHQFQAFVDKQFQVRGYQRVDFEFESSDQDPNLLQKEPLNDDQKLFDNIILEGNYLEYKPKNSRKTTIPKKNKLTLEDIYNEFWDFIDEDNLNFSYFIENDSRRSTLNS